MAKTQVSKLPTVIRGIKVPLSPDELQRIGKELAETDWKIVQLEEQKKFEADKLKGQIAELAEAKGRLRRLRLDEYRYERREVVVEWNTAEGVKYFHDPVTSEILDQEPIAPGEQIPMGAVQ